MLAVLGAGAMSADQVAAVRAVRPIERVLLWSRNPARASAKAEEIEAEMVTGPGDAVQAADIVTTITPATAPLFSDGELKPDAHINAMGAFTPAMREVPADTVERSLVIVDDLAAAAAEAGDLLQTGRVPDGTIGDVLAKRLAIPGDRPTLFKSVGIASQDVAAAAAALGVI